MPPSRRITMESTHARTGRLMKMRASTTVLLSGVRGQESDDNSTRGFRPVPPPIQGPAPWIILGGVQRRQKVLKVADLLDIVLEPGSTHRLGNCFRDHPRPGLEQRPFRHRGVG